MCNASMQDSVVLRIVRIVLRNLSQNAEFAAVFCSSLLYLDDKDSKNDG